MTGSILQARPSMKLLIELFRLKQWTATRHVQLIGDTGLAKCIAS